MALIPPLLACVLVGWLAQKKKGRTGAFWGLATFALYVILLLAVGMAQADRPVSELDKALAARGGNLAGLVNALGVSLVAGGAMAALVFTLPKPKA